MHARRAACTILLAVATLTAGCGKSEAEKQADCQKALTESATETHRPDACKDLSQDDYEVLLVDWTLRNGMSKEGEDTLDWLDDGSLNDSGQ